MGHSDGVNVKLGDYPQTAVHQPREDLHWAFVLLADILFATLVVVAVWQIIVYRDPVRWHASTTMCRCYSDSPRGVLGPPGLHGSRGPNGLDGKPASPGQLVMPW